MRQVRLAGNRARLVCEGVLSGWAAENGHEMKGIKGVSWVVFACVLAAACSRPPLKVATIQVGRSLNSDNSVGTITTRFKPDDTMYAAVITEGPGAGELSVKWMSGGRVLTEETKRVRYTDRAATEFHMDFAGAFPPGQYRVELFLDGESIGARDLTVEN